MQKILKVLSSILLVGVCFPAFAGSALAGTVPTVTSVSAGDSTSYLLRSDGTVWGWGNNSSGELGTSTPTSESSPIPISGLTNVKSVAGGYLDTIALKNDGTVWGLGYNISGQLGDNSTTTTSVPEAVYGLSSVNSIAAGGVFAVALKSDGTVWAWGDDEQGQLGLDWTSTSSGLSTYYSDVPVQVPGLPSMTQIAAGNDFGLALDNTGAVWGWGDSNNGQLGVVSSTSLAPTKIPGVANVKQVAAGYAASYALESDGTVWAWGHNTYSQLGNTGAQNQTTPQQVSGLSNVIAISASEGGNQVIALKSDGTLWSWGMNSSGELGNGSSANEIATPVEAMNLLGVVSVAAGGDFSLAVKSDGTVWAWGNNTDGQVGTGYSNVPIVVPTPFDAHLNSLTLDVPGLNFDADTLTYSIMAPLGTMSATFTPVADNPNVSITINGATYTYPSGKPVLCDLGYGLNSFAITVTSADQSASLTYTLNITVPEPPLTFAQNGYSVSTGNSVTVTGVTYNVYDDPVVNAPVTLTAPTGSWGTSSSTSDTVTTNVYGVFSDTWTAPTMPGPYTISAQGNNSSATTTVTVTSPSTNATGTSNSSGTGSSTSTGTSNTSSRTSGSSNNASSSDSGSSSTTSTATSGFNLPGIMMYGTVDSTGDSQSFPDGDSTVSINIPQGAFPSPEYLSVTTGSVLDVSSEISGLPTTNVPIVLGVNFAGPAPEKPITLTIQNPNILPGTVVYKLMSDGTLQPVPATVTAGQIQVSFSADPDFVLVTVKPGQRVITVAHHTMVVPAVVQKDGETNTTYMPIWYVMQLLNSLGVTDKWNGHNWYLTTATGMKTDLTHLSPGHGSMGIYVDGTLVQTANGFAANDPASGNQTTYMPIWYVMQMLNRLGIDSTWNGTTWSLNVGASK